ncbi:MAG TPA: alkaline phosphatase family protein [Candidatus Solibacter sp.]|nr:alkaline phosphatase family protein [Candidatus Solibacter sp.]
MKRVLLRGVLSASIMGLAVAPLAVPAGAKPADPNAVATTTPIKHLVVIFQENVSFDHYFGTYPSATNPAGEPAFHAKKDTPTVNGLNAALLQHNPNSSNPQRLDRTQNQTCDQDHDYTHEQTAFDNGLMDKFPETLGATGSQGGTSCASSQVMDYYDGNTVTALWNYAQNFAMSDNSYGTGFGPSSPGAINLISGNTFGATCGKLSDEVYGPVAACPAAPGTATPGSPAAQGAGTVFGDPQPLFDKCDTRGTAAMGGRNAGDLFGGGITWGWFQGGFDNCNAAHTAIGAPAPKKDYIPHHQPFQYYPQTANPQHLAPSSAALIGHDDRANHQYDLTDFWTAANSGNLPAVSYLKAPGYQDGHAGYSGPLDEQAFLVNTINQLQQLDTWKSTAVVIAYDDSDGWYDHQMSPILMQSQTSVDSLTGARKCGSNAAKVPSGPSGPQQARCGYGPRLPLLVISPYARENFVDHTLSDQSSILRFIEDNWSLGRVGNGSADGLAGSLDSMFDFSHRNDGKVLLDPASGQPLE